MAMPLNVLQVSEETAKAKLAIYRRAVKEQNRAQDRRIAAGYREIAAGRAMITLAATIQAGGLDPQGRPRLAVVRADAQRCHLERRKDMVVYRARMGRARITTSWSPNVTPGHVGERLVSVAYPGMNFGRDAEALVPPIPPEHRPRRGAALASLARFHVLWEADWQMAPPIDPALLKHIAGDLWSVYAVWELTDLERAVLVG
jgi:hypothetical protein